MLSPVCRGRPQECADPAIQQERESTLLQRKGSLDTKNTEVQKRLEALKQELEAQEVGRVCKRLGSTVHDVAEHACRMFTVLLLNTGGRRRMCGGV
jgi:hypothetical protein